MVTLENEGDIQGQLGVPKSAFIVRQISPKVGCLF